MQLGIVLSRSLDQRQVRVAEGLWLDELQRIAILEAACVCSSTRANPLVRLQVCADFRLRTTLVLSPQSTLAGNYMSHPLNSAWRRCIIFQITRFAIAAQKQNTPQQES
jgi:hypothetical protein